ARDGMPQLLDRQGAGSVAHALVDKAGELLLDADLRGVRDTDLAIELADHESDVFALEPDTPLFEQLDHSLDVVRPARDAVADEAAGGVKAELFVADDGGRVELVGQVAGRELIGVVKPFLVGQALVLHLLEHGMMLPTEGVRLLAPQAPLVGLHLAEAAL